MTEHNLALNQSTEQDFAVSQVEEQGPTLVEQSGHDSESVHTNKVLNKGLINNFNSNLKSNTTSTSGDDKQPIHEIIQILIKAILGFWKEHIEDFGYEPYEIIAIEGNFLKLYIPMPLISEDGKVLVREVAVAYVEDLWPYKRKLIFRQLKKLETKIPGHLIDCITTIILADTIHKRHPPVKSRFNWTLFYRIREDTLSQILDTLARAIENHVKAIEKGLKFEASADIKRLIIFNYEFSRHLHDLADRERPKPGTFDKKPKHSPGLTPKEKDLFKSIFEERWMPIQAEYAALSREERDNKRLDFRRRRKNLEQEIKQEIISNRELKIEKEEQMPDEDLIIFRVLNSEGKI